ncbi:hypothetical protein LCGC14_1144690 [marine sediment metagenome]|uniref:Uncharacterized protein n=1 Tax=marine sediment metagenome TaxID=412755 RepID=A0A0F9LXB5_9ZZZZ
MARKPKTRISDADMCRVGTVARSQDFSTRDLSKHLRRDAMPMVRRMLKEKLLTRTQRGRYFPTKKGWRSIENACEWRR